MFLYHLLNFIIFWILFFVQKLVYGYILESFEISFKNDESIYIPLLSFIVCFIVSIKFFNYYSLKKSVKDEIEEAEKDYKDPVNENGIFYKIKKILKWTLIIIIALGAVLILFVKSNLNEIKDLNKNLKELGTQKNISKPN
jgi:flagellar basal body-associated protein FliL